MLPHAFRIAANASRASLAASNRLGPCCSALAACELTSRARPTSRRAQQGGRAFASSSAPPPEPAVSIDGEKIADRGQLVKDTSIQGKADGETDDDDLGLVKGDDGTVRGKLSPTNSHLLRLTLPLPTPDRPCAFVLHPTQPLSYLARLISAEFPPGSVGNVEFRGFGNASDVRWSDSTDIGDFVHQAARVKSFIISLTPPKSHPSDKASSAAKDSGIPLDLEVLVPSFSARTRFLRERLRSVNESLRELGDLKAICDKEARRGARRVALSGLGGLLAYWGIVAKLSFDPNIGWDVMEPVTYLIGHGALVGGYCYFLLHSREPGYNTVLDRSITTRQAKLYETNGFDIERHRDLTREGLQIREEIRAISKEYGVKWDEHLKKKEAQEIKDSERLEERAQREGKEREEAEEKRKLVKMKQKRKDDDDD